MDVPTAMPERVSRSLPEAQTARAVVTIQMIFDLAFLAIAVRVLARAAEQAHSRRQS